MKFLFMIEDENGISWAGKLLEGEPWLLRFIQDNWITVRKLSETEVEEYQKLAGTYPRA